jgi:hypothetical protein
MMSVRSSAWEMRITSATVVAKQIKAALFGLCANQASLEALSAEVIRVSLWVQSAYKEASSFTDASVTTRNLLEQARALWTPIHDAYHNDSATSKIQYSNDKQEDKSESGVPIEIERDLLDAITEQGDMFPLKGGFWLPTPLRFVPLTQTHYLLVGSMPTHLLPDELLHTLHLHGSFRQINSSTIPALEPASEYSVQWQFQSLESWLGPSPQTLDGLTQAFSALELLPVERQHDLSLKAYVADKNNPQYLRWQSLDYVSDGRYLLQTSTPWGVRQYSVGYVSNHRLTKQSIELQDFDIRRLCYALDRQAGNPTNATFDKERGELILYSELPGRERKLLSTLGNLQENKEHYYPRRWINIQPGFQATWTFAVLE